MIKSSCISLNQTVFQAKGNIVSNMGGEKVMLSVEKGKYYNLGEIGGDIWELIGNGIKVNVLMEKLMEKYQVDQAVCQNHVFSFLENLFGEGLIETKEHNF